MAAGVPATTTGRDAARRCRAAREGRRWTFGLVIAVVVLASSADENTAGTALLDRVAAQTSGTVTKALVDQGFKNTVVDHGAGLGSTWRSSNATPPTGGSSPS
ncbi:hypothetical protein [Nonomuraea sp. CA-141351]|uniref:hypothetical protein n=1 Tax=Nonomuraea sp. CA-141351 TaxID=3239996 RepID=UPI003D921939